MFMVMNTFIVLKNIILIQQNILMIYLKKINTKSINIKKYYAIYFLILKNTLMKIDIIKKKKLNLFQNIKHILIKKNIEPQFLTKEFITISTLTCILIKLKMNLLKVIIGINIELI